jgi:hypothetical protein
MSEPASLGTLGRRAERARLAALLRAGGMPTVEIARRLGVRPGTVRDYLWDPERVRRAPRKRGICAACGTGVSAPGCRCTTCAGEARTVWTDTAILAAFARWRTLHGWPASSSDWARTRDPQWPSPATVIRRFGFFGAARRLAEKGDTS